MRACYWVLIALWNASACFALKYALMKMTYSWPEPISPPSACYDPIKWPENMNAQNFNETLFHTYLLSSKQYSVIFLHHFTVSVYAMPLVWANPPEWMANSNIWGPPNIRCKRVVSWTCPYWTYSISVADVLAMLACVMCWTCYDVMIVLCQSCARPCFVDPAMLWQAYHAWCALGFIVFSLLMYFHNTKPDYQIRCGSVGWLGIILEEENV